MDIPDGANQGHALIVAGNGACKNNVKVIRLIDHITNELQGRIPDFIKIDIEGYEMIALSTVKELFKHGKKPKYIFSEYYADNMQAHGIKPSEYFNMLSEMGYEIYNSDASKLIDRYDYDETLNTDIVANAK
jgi:hypothetical protein